MSRIGNTSITLPEKVKIEEKKDKIIVKGSLGDLSVSMFPGINFSIKNNILNFTRDDDSPKLKSLHGLVRSLCNNAVLGVSKGWEKILEINGIGYKVQKKNKDIILNLGYSHEIIYNIPEKIEIEIFEQLKIRVKGIDKSLVGQVAADIRKKRPPEPYKGKGIKYAEETIIRKVGKTGKK